MHRLVEIRSYKLKSGSGARFHDLVITQSMPLLRAYGTEVVAFGPSAHDGDAYLLIRAYDNLEDRRSSQETFYSSEAWRSGPRQAIIELIDADWNIVVWLTRDAVDAIRKSWIASTGMSTG
jgi:hypothetical protein